MGMGVNGIEKSFSHISTYEVLNNKILRAQWVIKSLTIYTIIVANILNQLEIQVYLYF